MHEYIIVHGIEFLIFLCVKYISMNIWDLMSICLSAHVLSNFEPNFERGAKF